MTSAASGRGAEAGAHARSRLFVLSPAAFVLALAVYVLLGVTVKTVVLNWIVGPLFPVLVLYLIPRLVRRAKGGDGAGESHR